MGHFKHHAIVVTSWEADRLEKAWNAAKEFGCTVTNMVGPLGNGYCTFAVVPDGSKEGWSSSYDGDDARENFKAWMVANHDGNWWEWVEVAFGADGVSATIIQTTPWI